MKRFCLLFLVLVMYVGTEGLKADSESVSVTANDSQSSITKVSYSKKAKKGSKKKKGKSNYKKSAKNSDKSLFDF